MNALHPSYECHCEAPSPRKEMGQDSGLCQACGYIYDPNLYEMRLRQFTPNYTYESLDEYLRVADPAYRALT